MSIEREKKGIVKKNHQLVVPIGVNFSRIKRLEEAEINRMNFVYMGHVKRNQGIELIVESFGDIVKEFPQARLTIIGGGDLEPLIREKVNQGGLSSCVEFKGFVPSHEEVEKMLASCGIGLALYEPNPESVTWYTDPSKPKQYMACGLPVIITVVPQIAEEVNSKNLGLVVDYERRSFVNAALRLLKDKDFYFTCRRNAIKFASGMQWELIFESAFSKSL
jgi:glycosyltransferase involved in cell wall biosynthesis